MLSLFGYQFFCLKNARFFNLPSCGNHCISLTAPLISSAAFLVGIDHFLRADGQNWVQHERHRHRFTQWHNDIFSRIFFLIVSNFFFCLLECEYMSKSKQIWPFVSIKTHFQCSVWLSTYINQCPVMHVFCYGLSFWHFWIKGPVTGWNLLILEMPQNAICWNVYGSEIYKEMIKHLGGCWISQSF